MSTVLVDSNVIFDVLEEDPVWGEWSEEALRDCAVSGTLVINPIIYAEVSVGYARVEDLEAAVPPDVFRREDLTYDAAFLAGKAYLAFLDNGGKRTTPLPDFYIGAHAATAKYELLTRDPKVYRTYFPGLKLITPDEH